MFQRQSLIYTAGSDPTPITNTETETFDDIDVVIGQEDYSPSQASPTHANFSNEEYWLQEDSTAQASGGLYLPNTNNALDPDFDPSIEAESSEDSIILNETINQQELRDLEEHLGEVNLVEDDFADLHVECLREVQLAIQASYSPTRVCDCTRKLEPRADEVQTLGKLSELWQRPNDNISIPNVLSSTKLYNPDEMTIYPWRTLLTVDQPLSFAETELQFYTNSTSALPPHLPIYPQTITRTFDIDAFLCEANCLSAHRHGFNLSPYPRYSRSISNDLYVNFHDGRPHQQKHFRFGEGHLTNRWSTYIVFPSLLPPSLSSSERQDSTHLSDEQLRLFYNVAVYPAIQRTLGNNASRMPATFDDGRVNAQCTQQESTTTYNGSQQLEKSVYIPARYLETLWTDI